MTDIVIILDESGSMGIMGPEPVQAMNAFIKEQQKILLPDSRFSLYVFSTGIRKIYTNIDLYSVPEYNDYNPRGMTSLFDCVKQAIIDNKEKNNVVFVIITDGDDTSSQNCLLEEAKLLLQEQRKTHNWQVLFLGANESSFKSSTGLGIDPNCIVSFSQDDTGDLLRLVRQISGPIREYRSLSANTDVKQTLDI